MFLKIEMDRPFFDDMEPEPKYSDELMLNVLEDAAGNNAMSKKYNEREVYRCVRKLILRGFVHGTVINGFECSWSRLTRKGRILLDRMRSEKEYHGW